MTSWKQRFQALVDELNGNKLLRVGKITLPPPASDADVRRATAVAGGALPTGMEQFYAEMNGFCVEWSMRDPSALGIDPTPTGSINLLPLILDRGDSVFGSWRDVIWFDENDQFRRVVPFDFFVAEACAALHPIPGAGVVHYHYLGEDLCSTGYAFEEYLNLLFESRGYLYWQAALCKERTPEGRNALRNLPKVFQFNGKPALGPKATAKT